MLRKVISIFKIDIALAVKDSIAIYMILAPLLLAVGTRAFIPTLDNIRGTVAIQEQVDARVKNSFTNYLLVEVMPDAASVIKRVERPDDIPGIILKDGEIAAVLEGNEQGEMVTGFPLMLDYIIDDEPVSSFDHQILPGNKIPVAEYMTISLILLGILLGSMIAGFNIVHERERGAIKALAVAPLKFRHFVLARGLFSLVVGTFIAVLSAVIVLGVQIPIGQIILTSVLGITMFTSVGLLIGAMAENQVQALMVIKILMMLFISVPVISIFVDQGWHWLFYLLPNYWMFRGYEFSFMGSFRGISYPLILLIQTATSSLLLFLIWPFARKRLKIR